MFIERLELHNFGPFAGRHTIDLSRATAGRPIVLVGGENGAGKTTVLDALLLALYGKMAGCSKRGSLGYPEFLERSIHQGRSGSDEAGVKVTFRRSAAPRSSTFSVHRTWHRTPKAVAESLQVVVDGQLSVEHSERWLEAMEELMPARIAPLFLFDGEKIEALAEPESASAVLSSAIHSLLGLDLVEHLLQDLQALERRKSVRSASAAECEALERLQRSTREAAEDHELKVQQRGENQAKIDRLHKELADLREDFRRQGGELLEQRPELERQHREAQADLQEAEAALRKAAEGAAPLLLVWPLVQRTRQQAEQERGAARTQDLVRLLGERDGQVVETLRRSEAVPAAALAMVLATLAADRDNRAKGQLVERRLDLDEEGYSLLRELDDELAAALRQELSELLGRQSEASGRLAELDRRLAAVPDQDAVVRLIETRTRLTGELKAAEEQEQTLAEELQRTASRVEQQRHRLARMLEELAEKQLERRDAVRHIRESSEARHVLGQFRTKVLQRHTERIAGEIATGLRLLLHKGSLIQRVIIDLGDFSLHLDDMEGREVEPRRLSAGERQLLAVATLWGLARASNRQLPVVIDTPLGRLDAAHRQLLVTNYFPNASHQVLLLSTDEEVDRPGYAQLQPHVAAAYRLVHDDEQATSRVVPGYFWDQDTIDREVTSA